MRLYSLAALTLALAGCVSANVKPTYSLAEAGAKGKGLLVMSVSTDIPDTSFSADTDFRFQGPAGPAGPSTHFTVSSHCAAQDKDFDNCGRLVAVELPAGSYVFWWQILPDLGYTAVIRPLEWEKIEVTVRAGKATYLGSFHMRLSTAGTVVGREANWGWPMPVDHGERDIALLLQRYPNLKREDVLMQVMDLPSQGQTIESPSSQVIDPPAAMPAPTDGSGG